MISMISLLYVLLAFIGIGILIFAHELGHYYVARRVGMRVETFSVGFGKPIYSWERDGVKWQIGWLPFGGYVKLAGEATDTETDPYEIKDGFFGKRPIDRIKMLFAGPFVNLVLAFLIFCFLWATGGREKNFSDYTSVIGWIDPKSELYAYGVRPGDEIVSYNRSAFQGAKDHLYAPMTSSGEMDISGFKVDYATGEKFPFDYKIHTYPHPYALEKGIVTAGILNSANYIIYDQLPNKKANPLPEGSPMVGSGVEYGDRVVWVDGELIFSGQQLSHILNDGKVLLTVVREGTPRLFRVPRVQVQELKLDREFRDELMDWQFEAGLNNVKLQKLYTIPYNITNDCVVEGELKFIDKESAGDVFPKHLYSTVEAPLLPRDRIIAIDGKPIKYSYELFNAIQRHQVNVIVEREQGDFSKISWKDADKTFDHEVDWNDLQKIARSIGTAQPIISSGDYHLLALITPKVNAEFTLAADKQASRAAELLEQKKGIESIEDPEKRAEAYSMLQKQEKQLLLGLPNVQDRKVEYNPNPFKQVAIVFDDIWKMLVALVTGSLNPKWMSGPIGIVQVVHDNLMVSFREALFWLGFISLNLGVLNLLPIPVLDGGSIVFAFFEMVTGKRIPPKTLEKLVVPFAVLLIAFFIFLTYQDLSRFFFRVLHW